MFTHIAFSSLEGNVVEFYLKDTTTIVVASGDVLAGQWEIPLPQMPVGKHPVYLFSIYMDCLPTLMRPEKAWEVGIRAIAQELEGNFTEYPR